MIGRRAILSGLAAAGALAARGAVAGKPQAPAAPLPRDLSGIWTNAWYTKLQRPKELKTLVVTPAEAEAFEKPRRAHAGELIDHEHDVVGQAESEFPDNGPGLARIGGQIRSSWITDPPDGRLPWKPGIKKALLLGEDNPLDNPEDRDPDERCVTREGGAAPLLNAHDANITAIVQGGEALVIVGEKLHETRIVRIVGSAGEAALPDPRAAGITQPDGVAIGWWEGRTLVVRNTGLAGHSKLADDLWLSGSGVVTERFTRTAADEILYAFEVDDPAFFTRTWKAEMVFRRAEGRLFEYACHEGNYGITDILTAARRMEAAKGGAGK